MALLAFHTKGLLPKVDMQDPPLAVGKGAIKGGVVGTRHVNSM